jgi:drug/metabolite transporter (DMT)-like permease
MARPTTSPNNSSVQWPWIVVALAAYTGWGAYPVLVRYLQTVSALPSMSLLSVGTAVALLGLVIALRPRLDVRIFRSKLLWAFVAVLLARSITNLLSARYTLAIYVQLINLMTPFLVVLLSATLLRDRIPPYTGRAIIAASIGAVLMMSGDIGQSGESDGLTSSDWLGIGLAAFSSLTLALYMILVRRSAQYDISGEAMLVVQLGAIVAVSLPLSFLLGEDWGQWQMLGASDWLIFAAFSLGVLLGANLGQIFALRHLGAPMVSTLLGWRLVVALVVAALLLDERLTSAWQVLGALIVLATITWYLRRQRLALGITTS